MASPGMPQGAVPPVPPPPPYVQPPRPPRSIAGAIVLIIIGVLFLLGTMGILDAHGLTVLFGKFWPALLILWGLIKLMEYEQAKRAGVPTRGIGVGGVFLMIFVICAGLIATGVSRVNWGNIRDNLQIDDEDFNNIFGGSSYDYSGDLSKDASDGVTGLRIADDRGTITVNVSDDKKVRVSWRKKVHSDSQEKADDINKRTDVAFAPGGDKILTLNANVQAAGDKGVSTDMDVYVPRNTDLTITSRHGDVSITGINGSIEINNQHGEVDINDQTGNATLNIESSAARIQKVKGDVTIQGRAKEVDVEDVNGAVRLNGEFMETVRLVRVTKTVDFHSSRTDMQFAHLDGRLDLDSGDLRADSLFGPMHLSTRSKDIALEGLTGDLRLEDTNGTVEVGVYKPGNIQIDNRKGDVRVTIPPGAAMKVEARTHEGDIESDFEEIKVDSEHRQSSASGAIGSNGSKLAINCEKGTIEIRRGTVAVTAPTAPTPPSIPKGPTKALPAPKAKPVESEN
ncbi:MAG TPA: DUF4097 family beta strand repeat-containing protein [Terriglobales bacterium]|nr:DUF4097 family beta strand repeat-containing protein [Terriglobales bacterium]